MLHNTSKTLGFQKIMVYKTPPGGEVNHISLMAYLESLVKVNTLVEHHVFNQFHCYLNALVPLKCQFYQHTWSAMRFWVQIRSMGENEISTFSYSLITLECIYKISAQYYERFLRNLNLITLAQK